MANDAQLNMLRRNVVKWNAWRQENLEVEIDLTGANLRDANLVDPSLLEPGGGILIDNDLTGADPRSTNLTGADLTGADLTGATLRYANLRGAILTGATLKEAMNLTQNQLDSACIIVGHALPQVPPPLNTDNINDCSPED